MIIEIRDLTKIIKGAEVLSGINMHLEQGNIYGFQGKNGCGKTMLMRVICGLIYSTRGTVNIDGKILGKDISFPDSVGVLIENPSFIAKYTGFKNLKVLAMIKDKITDAQIRQTLTAVGLDCNDSRVYRKYSLGMKQRLGIACTLMEQPDLILLDEPFNALDENGCELIKKLLFEAKERGSLIIIACHDKEELELLSDEIFNLADGKVINHVTLSKS